MSFGSGLGVDVSDAAGESVVVEGDFSCHRVGNERQSSGLHRRSDEDVGGREVRVCTTTAVALPAIVTRLSAVVRFSQN